MFIKELQRIAPPLASYVEFLYPDLSASDVDTVSKRGIASTQNIGRCFLFSYKNPAGKGTKKLPYYHMFPMVFVLEQTKGNFLGLNPFYLPPNQRKNLIDTLLENLNNDIEDERARVLVTYDIINTYSRKFKNAFPCLKRYRYNLMSKVVMQMKPSLWEEFYLGEVSIKQESLFKGASPKKIWRDSMIIAEREARKR